MFELSASRSRMKKATSTLTLMRRPKTGTISNLDSSRSQEAKEEAMSQLAAMITGDDKKRSRKKTSAPPHGINSKTSDPVSAILSSVGVQYTHENSEVIGSSKVEARLSKRAQEAADERGAKWATQEQQNKGFLRMSPRARLSLMKWLAINVNGGIRYKYRPPEPVKRRQLCTMAEYAGYSSVVEFACAVEAWTQEERRESLSRFYRWRASILDEKVKTEEDLSGLISGKDFNTSIKAGESAIRDLSSRNGIHAVEQVDSGGAVKAEVKSDSSDDEL